MTMISTRQILSLAAGSLVCALLVLLPACSIFGEKTKTCSTTCFSERTGDNLGTVSFDDYTRKECEEALENRQTILTQCTLTWE